MGEKCWPRIGVGAVVIRGREILLVKRKYPPFKGKWSIPGGHLKPGETVFQAALRELLEETSVRGRALGIVDIHELVMEGGGGVERHYLLVDVLVEYTGGSVEAGSDAEDAKWFAIEEALGADVTPSTRKLLEKLVRIDPDDLELMATTVTRCRGEASCS